MFYGDWHRNQSEPAQCPCCKRNKRDGLRWTVEMAHYRCGKCGHRVAKPFGGSSMARKRGGKR